MQLSQAQGVVAITGPLSIGSRGKDVQTLQRTLNRMNPFLGLQPDGSFGIKTDAAVRAFQRSKNLKPDGIVGPLTASALGLLYIARPVITQLPRTSPQAPQQPRGPLETPVLPGPSAESAIAQIVAALVQGFTEVKNGVIRIVLALEDLPDVVGQEIRDLLSGPFQTAIGILRGCVSVAAANAVAGASIVSAAIQSALQKVISALQACLGVLSRLPDFLGLSGIANQIRSIIAKLQREVDRIIDMMLRTLRGVGISLFEAAAAILGILRGAVAV